MPIDDLIQKNVPLAPLTTFRVGGPARYFFSPQTDENLLAASAWAKEKNLPVFILGGGSNLLVSDQGFSGLVVKPANRQILIHGQRLDAGAGASLARAAMTAASQNLSGLEWSVGIPGATLGGVVRGNAGAFGRAIGELVETVKAYDRNAGRFTVFSRKDCRFAYRESIFFHQPHLLLWQIGLKLETAEREKIDRLAKQSADFRRRHYPQLPSAGSIFKNLDAQNARLANPEFFASAQAAGAVKDGQLAAGFVIDRGLNLKGKMIGGAKVSLEHANHIVNTGSATAAQIMAMIVLIKNRAASELHLVLEEEIKILGNF